ncbi:MAG TPA: hypothetical protein VMW23_06345 [Sedimentisphaerales bacterium]|nr:hypothetical protein [Sedimentisphaerales bacterium]
MAELAGESGNYELQTFSDSMCMDIINFIPRENLGHDDLHGQLIYEHKKENQIRVEIRARAWNPEYPTRVIYLEASHHIFDGLIKTYNSKYKKRYHIRVVKEKSPNLPPKATKALKNFALLANKNILHKLDWERLYQFVRVCHATRTNPSKGLIWGMLSKEGFDDKKAEYIADVASHLLDFMKYK